MEQRRQVWRKGKRRHGGEHGHCAISTCLKMFLCNIVLGMTDVQRTFNRKMLDHVYINGH